MLLVNNFPFLDPFPSNSEGQENRAGAAEGTGQGWARGSTKRTSSASLGARKVFSEETCEAS